MTVAPCTLPKPVAVKPSAILSTKIVSLRRKHVSTAALTGTAMVVIVGTELLALAMFVDWWLELPWAVRLISLLAQLAVFSYLTVRFIVITLIRQPEEDELALMMEKARPEFRGRLIASLQLTRPGAIPLGASASMVEALVEHTEAFAAPMNFPDIVPTDRLKKFGTLAILIPALAFAGFLYGHETCTDLLKRVCLSNTPVPRKTRVFVENGDKIIGFGDNVRLEASVRGIIPATGRLRLEFRSRHGQEFTLEQDKAEPARFGRTIENVQDSFRYKIYLNDGESPWFSVKAIPRPTVATIQCEQEFPAYSQLKPTRRSLGDLTLLAGSKLKLAVTATKPLKSASLKQIGLTNAADVPMQVNAQSPQELAGELTIPAKGLTGFQVQMLDTDGMESRDSAVYRIEVLPDKVPVVRITYPDRKEELVTRRARMLVAFDAVDDFAIAKIQIRYKIAAPDNGTAQVNGAESFVELDLAGEQPQRVKRRHEWTLSDLPLTEGSVIEYWLEVRDNNDATGPGIGTSDHQLARVVSENEKRADLLNRAGDYMGSIGDAASDQERLNQSLGAVILEKTGPK